jgi:hypothetical protein
LVQIDSWGLWSSFFALLFVASSLIFAFGRMGSCIAAFSCMVPCSAACLNVGVSRGSSDCVACSTLASVLTNSFKIFVCVVA